MWQPPQWVLASAAPSKAAGAVGWAGLDGEGVFAVAWEAAFLSLAGVLGALLEQASSVRALVRTMAVVMKAWFMRRSGCGLEVLTLYPQ